MVSDIKIPKGYKQTEVGVIPQDWKIRKIGDIAEVKTGPFGSTLHEKDYVDHGTPIITVEHLGERGVVHDNLPMVSDYDKKRLKPYSLQIGDIVFSRVGSVDRNSIIKENENDWLFSGRLLRIRLNSTYMFPQYLSYHLHQEPTKQRIRSVAVGQTMPSLNTEILKDFEVIFPPSLEEQRAIAEALGDVDELIGGLDKLIAKKRNIKQGTMQQLLTGKKRLPGFSGEWEEKTFDDCFSFLSTGSNSRSDLRDEGDVKYIHYGDIHTKWNLVLDCATDSIPAIDLNKVQRLPFIQEGDLVIADASEDYDGVGKSVEIINLNGNMIVSGLHTLLLRSKDGIFVNGFKAYINTIPKVKQWLQRLATGLKVYGISKTNLKLINIPIPNTKEQQAIVEILSDMEAEIESLESKRDKYKQIKQGMMQELLTGKTRLI